MKSYIIFILGCLLMTLGWVMLFTGFYPYNLPVVIIGGMMIGFTIVNIIKGRWEDEVFD